MSANLPEIDPGVVAGLGYQACVLRLAWNEGLINRQDVAKWADSWLLLEASSEELGVLADLSVPISGDDSVLMLLASLASPCTGKHIRALVGVVAQIAKAGGKPDKVALMLYRLHGTYDDGVFYEMSGFWDEYDCAQNGIYGDLAEVRLRIKDCLKQHEYLADWLQLRPPTPR